MTEFSLLGIKEHFQNNSSKLDKKWIFDIVSLATFFFCIVTLLVK